MNTDSIILSVIIGILTATPKDSDQKEKSFEKIRVLIQEYHKEQRKKQKDD
tara:strand:- start:9726 stop:9878 length:153 start_codon:yes stop_codon:yes gene_type:complete